MKRSIRRIRIPVKREGAERYLMLTLVSFATSVILTRQFLEFTGYPQVGNSELHIAHVLWGGLLLFVASLLPLLFANRWVYQVGALSAGVGVGLFIDEVGKFITQTNNYFYPGAAPIVYAFFLLTVLLYLQMRRPRPRDARVELYHTLEAFEEVLDRNLTTQERANLNARLQRVVSQTNQPDIVRLANALQEFLASDALDTAPDSPGFWERWLQQVRAYGSRWITKRRLKAFLVGGLGLSGLGALLISLAVFILVPLAPPESIIFDLPSGSETILQPVLLEHVNFATLISLLVEIALWGVVGLSLVVAAVLMVTGHEQRGSSLAYFGLLLSLSTVTLLDFYFNQFRAISGALIDFVLLMGVMFYRRRYLLSKPGDHTPTSTSPKTSTEPPP